MSIRVGKCAECQDRYLNRTDIKLSKCNKHFYAHIDRLLISIIGRYL